MKFWHEKLYTKFATDTAKVKFKLLRINATSQIHTHKHEFHILYNFYKANTVNLLDLNFFSLWVGMVHLINFLFFMVQPYKWVLEFIFMIKDY